MQISLDIKQLKEDFKMGVRDLVIALIVVKCGGNPNMFFNKT